MSDLPPVETKKASPPKSKPLDPPLIAVTVTNPVTYLKLWWKKIIGNEGVDVRLRIHPLTALAIAGVFAIGSFGLGRITAPAVIAPYLPQFTQTVSPEPTPYRDTAFSGFLRYSITGDKFYLQTEKAEAITLEVPENVDLFKFVDRRIFATGRLNLKTGVLTVAEATDLEILPTEVTHIPASSPAPSPTPSAAPSPSPTPPSSPAPETDPSPLL